MDNQEKYHNDRISELENFISGVEEDFSDLADDIIDKVCKRAIKRMNKDMDNLHLVTDDFPNNFTFFDRLSVLYDSRTYDEMGYPDGMLERYITETLDGEIDSLPRIEKLILYYSNCYQSYVENDDSNDASYRAENRFKELLDEHTSLVKIQKFLSVF